MAQRVALSKTSSMTFRSLESFVRYLLSRLEPQEPLPELFLSQAGSLGTGRPVKGLCIPSPPSAEEAENLLVYNSYVVYCSITMRCAVNYPNVSTGWAECQMRRGPWPGRGRGGQAETGAQGEGRGDEGDEVEARVRAAVPTWRRTSTRPRSSWTRRRRRSEDYLTRLKYLQADFENYRKRVDSEMREIEDFSTSELMKKLLPVLDDLDLAAGIRERPTRSPRACSRASRMVQQEPGAHPARARG